MKSIIMPIRLTTAGFTVILAATALAADQTWNISGPSNAWNTTDLNWDALAAWTNGNTAIFSGTGEAITVGTITAAGMTFSGTGYTLSSGTITQSGAITTNESATVNSNIALSANQSWTTAAGKTLTLGGAISGSSTLTYGGSGTYVINGANSNTGNLTIDAATVHVNAGKTLLGYNAGWIGRSVTLQNGGVLEAYDYANNGLWGGPSSGIGDGAANIIFGSGGGTFSMLGTTMDSGVNKGFTINSGSTGHFHVPTGTSATWSGSYSGRDFTVNSTGTLDFNGGGNFTTSRFVSGSGNVTKSDAGTLTLQSVNSFSGSLTVNGGTLVASAATSSGTSSGTGNGSATNVITVNSGATLKYTGSRGAGYHQANANINGGTITMDAADQSLAVGKTVKFDTAAGTINGTGQWRFRGGATAQVTAAATGSTISVATLDLYDGTQTFNIETGAVLTVSSQLTRDGGGVFNKSGGGTLVLSGNSSAYTGASSVSAGTLLVTGSLGGSVTVASSATVGGTGTVGGNLSMASGSFFDIFLALSNPLDVGGTVTFATGFGIDNLLNNGAAVDWSTISDNTYTLIAGTVNTANLDNLGLANAYDIGGGRKAYFQGGSLQLVVVPEPASALLLGLGALGISLRRRRA